jgi:hypothetical protein
MTFLAPLFFYMALGVAAGAVALHFIVTRQPTSSPLPTVRFVPPSAVRVTTVAPVPEDLLLLLVRVLAVLCIGAALARPVLVPHRRRVARVVRRGAPDSAARLVRTARGGRLSPALIAAMRAASTLRDAADSIELAIISPLRANEIDGATQAIRALWPGRIRVIHVPGAADSLAPPVGLGLRASADDPIAIAASIAGLPSSDTAVRVVRGDATAADSAWAAGPRHTLVRWPLAGAPQGWRARTPMDTAGAVVAGEAALVFPLERRWQLDSASRITRVAARWVDGAPAAIERSVGSGCIRDIAIPVPTRGDLILRPAFGRLVRALMAPCAAVSGGLAADSATRSTLAGNGALASHDAIRAPDSVATPLVPWLLALAILLVLLELFVRRHSAPMWSDVSEDAEPQPRTGAVA